MFASLIFTFFRLLELVTLVPALGMLAWWVNNYAGNNQLTPNYILVLFIVSVLAAAWAFATLLRRDSTKRSAHFVAFIDLCFIGALIAGVYELRDVGNSNCTNITGGVSTFVDQNGNILATGINYTPFGIDGSKTCSMLKASWVFGIMNCIFFAVTAAMAVMIHRHERTVVVEKTYSSRRRSHDSRRGNSASGSRRRSSRDSRRQYYV